MKVYAKGRMEMTKQEVQAILDKRKNKREIGKKLKRLGYHNTRYYKPTNGTNLQEIAKACNEECDEADREKYYLFASLGNYNGYEWIWLEQTQKSPNRYSVSIWVKEL